MRVKKNYRLPMGLGRRPFIAASLGEASTLLADARAAVRDGADLLEVRVDRFPAASLTPDGLARRLVALRRAVSSPILLTVRHLDEGGALPSSVKESDRRALFSAGLPFVDGVDVELGATGIRRAVLREAHRKGRFVVLSHHDFETTPSDAVLRGISRRARAAGADVVKIAVQPRDDRDVARFLELCRRDPAPCRVYIAMGARGLKSRVRGFEWGSAMTYGYARKPLAPGQLSVKKLSKIIDK